MGWKGNWCNSSWEEEDWEGKVGKYRGQGAGIYGEFLIKTILTQTYFLLLSAFIFTFASMSGCASTALMIRHPVLKGFL